MSKLQSKVPDGPLAEKWTNHKSKINLVSPANKRSIDIIVVGTGLAGASASATLAELGYNVKTFCFQDSPRRAHSIAAQGGINALNWNAWPVFVLSLTSNLKDYNIIDIGVIF